jgi:hypothetical protein
MHRLSTICFSWLISVAGHVKGLVGDGGQNQVAGTVSGRFG